MHQIIAEAADLATIIASLVAIFGVVIALRQLSQNLASFKATMEFGHYTEIDRLYFEIVSLRIAHSGRPPTPSAGSPDCSRDDAGHYHALVSWNFIEAIHDRCLEGNDRLMGTWLPIIRHEAALHTDWFRSNPHFFKETFRAWVLEKGLVTAPPPAAATPP